VGNRLGDLVTTSLRFENAETRLYGDAAVTIGRHVQEAAYQATRPAASSAPATSRSAAATAGGWPVTL
jgi:hypothetical protein